MAHSIRHILLLTILLLMAGLVARAQTATWQAAWVIGSGGASTVRGLVPDAAGNVYVTGNFSGTVQIGGTTLTSTRQSDIDVYVAKWSAVTGSWAWAVRAGGTGYDFPSSLAVVGNNVYVTGWFESLSARFGSQTLTNANTDPGQAPADVFVWKLTDQGTAATTTWAVRAGGRDSDDVAFAMAVVGNSVYLGGTYSDAATFGVPLPLPGGADAFVARLTDTGSSATWNWAVGGGGPGSDEVRGLAVVGSSVYVAGHFQNTATFGSPAQNVSSAGGYDIFAAKLTDAGAYVWVQRGGSSGFEYLRALTAVGSNVYLSGEFTGATTTFGATNLTNAAVGSTDVFVAKLTDAGSTGTHTWAQRLGGAGNDSPTVLVAQGRSVYVGGFFEGPSMSLGTTVLTNTGAGTSDGFVGRLLDAGASASVEWAQSAGGSDYVYLRALAIGGTRLYAGGAASLPTTFGNQTLPGAAGSSASFLATLADPALPARAATALPDLTIFPNPAHGATTVRVPAGTGAATVQVLDALGRVLRTANAPAGADYALSVAGLVPGVYAVRVQLGQATAVQRLVVE